MAGADVDRIVEHVDRAWRLSVWLSHNDEFKSSNYHRCELRSRKGGDELTLESRGLIGAFSQGRISHTTVDLEAIEQVQDDTNARGPVVVEAGIGDALAHLGRRA